MRRPRCVWFLFALATCAPAAKAMQEQPLRRVHVSQEVALAATTMQFEVVQYDNGQIFGRFWATSGDANRAVIEQRFGCTADRRGRPGEQWWHCSRSGLQLDWSAVLSALDRADVMDPPPDTPNGAICMDGAPWRVTVRRYPTGDSIVTDQACGPRTQARVTFERRIDSIITGVLSDVEHAHVDDDFHLHGIEPIAGLRLGLPGVISAPIGLRLGLGDWIPGGVFVAAEPGLLVRRWSAGYMLLENQITSAGLTLRAARLKAWLPAPFVRRDVNYGGGEISMMVYRIGVYRGRQPGGPAHWLVTADVGLGF